MNSQFDNGYALLIGINENHVTEWSLPDVMKDIEALARVLTDSERCAYPVANVKMLTGQEATRQGILDGLEWLQECIEADTSGNATAVVCYTGHGWRDMSTKPAEFYFIPYDVKAATLRSRALRALDFAEAVGELRPQRLLVVLDCCHAAGLGVKDVMPLPDGYVEAALAPALLMTREKAVAGPGAKGLEELAQGHGRAVLSSSSGEQKSYIRKDRSMSIFTYHLIEALTGHAQVQEGATEVLVSDVMSYVYWRVPESTKADWNKEQTPDYQVSGNFPIALLLGGKGLSKGELAPNPLEMAIGEEATATSYQVDTGGGDHIGRDKIIHGDEVHGDKVGGDKITTGNISGTGIALGRGAQAIVNQAMSHTETLQLLMPLRQAVEQAELSPEHRHEAEQEVESIAAELAEPQPNGRFISEQLMKLAAIGGSVAVAAMQLMQTPVIQALIQRVTGN